MKGEGVYIKSERWREAEIWRNAARWWLTVCVNSVGPQDPDI